LENIMAVNRFGFPAQNTAEVGAFTITADQQLSSGGANILLITSNKAAPGTLNVAMPNPAGLDGYVLEIQNESTTLLNTLTIRQYNSTAFTGAVRLRLALIRGARSGRALRFPAGTYLREVSSFCMAS
jgi:hypothetical protein